MKIDGKSVKGPHSVIIPIPRPTGDLIFHATAIVDMKYEESFPMPQAKEKLLAGGAIEKDVENPEYKKALTEWSRRKIDWIILKSLTAEGGLEWETVKMDDPSTWGNYRKELEDSGFSLPEINRMIAGVFEANGLNEDKIEEARKRFLLGAAKQQKQ